MFRSRVSYDDARMKYVLPKSQETLAEMVRVRMGAAHERLITEVQEDASHWLHLPYAETIKKFILPLARSTKRFDTLLVLGIGGSDLGARAILRALPHKKTVLFSGDNTDPDALEESLAGMDWSRTLVNVVSKSGTTMETMAAFLVVRDRLRRALGASFSSHIIATTDPKHGILRSLAATEGYAMLPIPSGVGGRFSVLSAAGIFPAAWAGVDMDAFLQGASLHSRLLVTQETPAFTYAYHHVLGYILGRTDWVLMPYAAALDAFGDWYRQLIAESLGKQRKMGGQTLSLGPTPVSAIGARDQHSQLQLYMDGPDDKIISFIEIVRFRAQMRVPRSSPIPELASLAGKTFQDLLHASRRATSESLDSVHRPHGTFTLSQLDAHSLGQLFQIFMTATVLMGYALGVDPYGQPGVEDGKKRMKKWLKQTKR